jgi:hypothetical protein
MGLEGVTTGDFSPDLAPGVGAFARVRSGAFSLALEAQADFSIPFHVGSGMVQSIAVMGGLAPCAHFGPVFACVTTQLGALHAWSPDVPGARRLDGLLVESTGRVGVEWPLSSTVAVRLRGDAGIDWLPHEIGLAGSTWPQPRVALALASGLVVRFR